nr:HAD family phosphatase [Haladaptatus sp. R4]
MEEIEEVEGAERQAVLFDMDGVIVNSEDFWAELEEEIIFPEVGVEDIGDNEITGMNFREIYDYLDEEYGTDVTKSEFISLYDGIAEDLYGEHVSLMDGFHDLLDELRAEGIEVALVSSSPHDWIEIVTDRFGLEFEEVVSADDIDAPGKPEPAIYEYAAGLLDYRADECAAVEDSEHGVESAFGPERTVSAIRTARKNSTSRWRTWWSPRPLNCTRNCSLDLHGPNVGNRQEG